jgi:nitrite reductase (NADH) small subunit
MSALDRDPPGAAAPTTVRVAGANRPSVASREAAPAWVEVCALDDVPLQGARVLKRAGRTDIALFRSAAGAVFALLDRCPHRGGPLSQGIVYGERVACPLHNWSIGLADGAAAAPDVGCTRAFSVRVEAGRVLMDAAQLHAGD